MTTPSEGTSKKPAKPRAARKPKATATQGATPVPADVVTRVLALIDVAPRLNRSFRLRAPKMSKDFKFRRFRGTHNDEVSRIRPSRESLRILARRARIVDHAVERSGYPELAHFERPDRQQSVREGRLTNLESILGYAPRSTRQAHGGYGDQFLRNRVV